MGSKNNRSKYFDFDSWYGQILITSQTVKDIYMYLVDEKAWKLHIDNRYTFTSNLGNLEKLEIKSSLFDSSRKIFDFESSRYLNHMEAFFFAVLEGILND